MPIYDFQCTSCGFKDELMRKSSDINTIACPQCHAESFSKMLSAPSFQLNGTGWYATDFKDKKSKTAEKNQPESKVTESTKEPVKTTTEVPAANNKPAVATE